MILLLLLLSFLLYNILINYHCYIICIDTIFHSELAVRQGEQERAPIEPLRHGLEARATGGHREKVLERRGPQRAGGL